MDERERDIRADRFLHNVTKGIPGFSELGPSDVDDLVGPVTPALEMTCGGIWCSDMTCPCPHELLLLPGTFNLAVLAAAEAKHQAAHRQEAPDA